MLENLPCTKRRTARKLLTLACAAAFASSTANAHAQDVAPAPAPAQPPPLLEPSPVPVPAVDAPVAPPAPVPAVSAVLPPAPTTPAAEPAPPVVVSAPAPAPAATPPAAPGWTPVFTGSYFTRYEMRANYDDMGVSRGRFLEGDAAFYRARFGFGTGLMDIGKGLKVGLQFTPQVAGVFGALGPNTVADAALGLHEGYTRIQGSYLRFDAGRFELNYGEALVIGNLDWNELGRSFDGVRARLASSPTSAWLDLFATMVDEGRDPALTGPAAKGLGFGDGDVYFFGAYAALGPALMPGLDLDLYALAQGYHGVKGIKLAPADPMSATYVKEGATQATFGARIKQKIKVLDYRAEAGLQTGSRLGATPTAPTMGMTPATRQAAVDVMAYQIDAEVGLNLLEDKLRVAAEGIYASGDDAKSKKNEGWDELYPTAHKFLGLADVFHLKGIKRTNVTSAVLHLTLKPSKDFSVQADGHLFSRPEKVGTEKGRAGAELDVGAAYTLGKGLKLRALYAVFLPDKDFYPVAPATGQVDPIHYAELELRYDLLP
jgi:hypothetical protein